MARVVLESVQLILIGVDRPVLDPAELKSAMPEFDHGFVERVLAGDRRCIAQAISAVENRDASAVQLLRELYPQSGRARVIGLTGSPGAGKSTLVERLAEEYRRRGGRVGILAVDPTSPYSGGAILGDRVRMQALSRDSGVYIRSMATRGQLGGLAPTTQDAVTILDAAGYEFILVETVGVGQDEVEIARLADVTVLLLVPGLGDDIQTFKAGVMEIADVFVVNKADRAGAERVEQEVSLMLSIAPRADGWRQPIVRIVATTGKGIEELAKTLDEFFSFSQQGDLAKERRLQHSRSRLFDLLRQTLFERAVAVSVQDGAIERQIEEIVAHRKDPHEVVEKMVAALLPIAQNGISSLGLAGGTRIHHLGIAVESLADAAAIFQRLIGRGPATEEVVSDQKVRVASFHLGGSRIELLEATDASSPIARFIAKRGQGIHHVALTVHDLAKTLRNLESDGVRLIDHEPRQGADKERIAFIHPSGTAGVLIELVEEK